MKRLKPPSKFNDAAIQLTPSQIVQGLARVRGFGRPGAVTCTLGLLLLIPVTTLALELGEASVRSGLGQSLFVQIPYRLATGERLTPECVQLVPSSQSTNSLPTYTRVSRIAISATNIEIYDNSIVREPLIGLTIDVHCASTPHFARSYELFVDPPVENPATGSNRTLVASAPARRVENVTAPVAATPRAVTSPTANAPAATIDSSTGVATNRTARASASPRARGHAGGDVPQGQTYRVVRGDTLSGIAARIAERPGTIHQTAEAIFVANLDAFTRGNRDRIEEGRSISIPVLTPSTATARVVSAPAPAVAARATEPSAAAPASAANSTTAPTSATQPSSAAISASVTVPSAIAPLPAPLPVPAPIAAPVAPIAVPVPAPVATAAPAPVAAPVPAATRTTVAPQASAPSTTGRPSTWLMVLLAVGVVVLLSAPLAFVRRRKQQAAAQADGAAVKKARPRKLVDPVAGFDVVEARVPSDDKIAPPRSAVVAKPVAKSAGVTAAGAIDVGVAVGPTDAVDLDVGTPLVNEGIDWFGDKTIATKPQEVVASDETIEDNAATARMPDIEAAVTALQPSLRAEAERAKRALEDEQMTMTIVELDMLRQDYEAAHTLTQHGSQELRKAIEDLAATKAAHAATAETSTMELPQQPQEEEPADKPFRARAK